MPSLFAARHNHHHQNSHRSSPPRLLRAHPRSSNSRKQGIRQKGVSSYTGWHFGTPMARAGVNTWVFAQSQGRDDERRTTNDERAPNEELLLSSGAVRRETPNEQNEHKSAGPGAAQAQHGPWHQRVPDCKRQLQTVLNPGRPIRLGQHRLACAFVHLCLCALVPLILQLCTAWPRGLWLFCPIRPTMKRLRNRLKQKQQAKPAQHGSMSTWMRPQGANRQPDMTPEAPVSFGGT